MAEAAAARLSTTRSLSAPLGSLLVAATSKGVCSVKLGDTEAGLEADLKQEFSAAQFHRDEEQLSKAVRAVVDHLEGKSPHIDLPLDIQATAFQRQVWEQLRAIPLGQTFSYSEVAGPLVRRKLCAPWLVLVPRILWHS